MTRLVWTDSEGFFEDAGYPVDLEQVEARDGIDDALEFLSAELPAPPGKIVDLGCGHGRHAGPLGQMGYQVTGVDISGRCVARARERFPELAVYRADSAALPFPDGAFDAVYSVYSSIGLHGASPYATLREAARVSRAGATLILDVENAATALRVYAERVPGGVAVGLRWSSDQTTRQRSLVLSRAVVGLYGLKYARLGTSLTRLLSASGWQRDAAWSGFDRRPYSPSSPRLVVRARRAGP